MKIRHKKQLNKIFKDLATGDIFALPSTEILYMKIQPISNGCIAYNCINLLDGLAYFLDDGRSICHKNVVAVEE